MLEQWARQGGYELLNSEYRWFSKGPFFWSTGKGQAVYCVRVKDAHGAVRSGYVRCGSWLAGLSSDDVAVEWDA